jgi:hypothetical protein
VAKNGLTSELCDIIVRPIFLNSGRHGSVDRKTDQPADSILSGFGRKPFSVDNIKFRQIESELSHPMRKKILAFAILAAVPLTAQQSTQGNVDLGVLNQI